jgi:hypothetical protein
MVLMGPFVQLAKGCDAALASEFGFRLPWVVGLPLFRRIRTGIRMDAAPAAPRASHIRRVYLKDTAFVTRPLQSHHRNDVTSRLLSWVFFKDLPSVVFTGESTPGCPGPNSCQAVELVPPLPFFTTSAVCSSPGLVGLFRPTTDHGVHLVLS